MTQKTKNFLFYSLITHIIRVLEEYHKLMVF